MSASGGREREDAIAGVLQGAERRIALLEACLPLNAQAERERVVAGWLAGHELVPRWLLPRRADLTDVRAALAGLATASPDDVWGRLYGARAAELDLEAALVEARGTPLFRALCARRYAIGAAELREELERARRWIEETQHVVELPEGLMASSAVLAQALQERARELGLEARVVVRAELASVAGVGDGVVFVGAGTFLLAAAQVPRVVCHEIEGHLAPRVAALGERRALFRVGSAGAGEDEEGRALLLEERRGFLDPGTLVGATRRRELALRHLVAHATRAGADFVELMRSLLQHGAPVERAYRTCERALRGGGLGRELAYLPAYGRVRRAFAEAPSLEDWMRRGRVSLEAARALEALEQA